MDLYHSACLYVHVHVFSSLFIVRESRLGGSKQELNFGARDSELGEPKGE